MRIVDFGNSGSDVVFICFSYSSNGDMTHGILKGSNTIFIHNPSSIRLQLNQWQHVAFVYKIGNGLLYLNGVQQSSISAPSNSFPNKVFRMTNHIGRSNWYPSDVDANADFDELKIFNKALTFEEVQYEMNTDMFC
jgi:hypothetical protein